MRVCRLVNAEPLLQMPKAGTLKVKLLNHVYRLVLPCAVLKHPNFLFTSFSVIRQVVYLSSGCSWQSLWSENRSLTTSLKLLCRKYM